MMKIYYYFILLVINSNKKIFFYTIQRQLGHEPEYKIVG